MPRQTLAKTAAPGPFPTAGVAVTMTAADIANFEQFTWTGRELIIIQNSHATTAYTWTLTSVSYLGRTGNITTESLAAGEIRVIGPLSDLGWRQTDGYIYLQASNVAIKFGVITIP